MAPKVYVWGTEGRMKSETVAPTRSISFEFEAWGWKGIFFRVKRGVLEEHKSHWDGRHVYVREVPPELVEEVLDAELRVERLEEELKQAKAERQLALKVAAVRGLRIKRPDAIGRALAETPTQDRPGPEGLAKRFPIG